MPAGRARVSLLANREFEFELGSSGGRGALAETIQAQARRVSLKLETKSCAPLWRATTMACSM